MLSSSAKILWKCKRQLSDPSAAPRKPEVVPGAAAIFRDAIKVSTYFGVGQGFLYLGLGDHHFWPHGITLGGETAFHCA